MGPCQRTGVLHERPSFGGTNERGGAKRMAPPLRFHRNEPIVRSPVQPQELEALHSRQVSQAPARIMRVELQALSGHTLPVKPCFLAISNFWAIVRPLSLFGSTAGALSAAASNARARAPETAGAADARVAVAGIASATGPNAWTTLEA